VNRNILLAHLEQAKRHLHEGERLLAEQRARIEQLRRDGHRTAPAEALLTQFEETQRLHLGEVARLTIELERE
jgi:hypothetical protein